MTPRENLLSLLRREGYEWVPCEFRLTEPLMQEFYARYGKEKTPEEAFDFAWRYPRNLQETNTDKTRFLKYYSPAIQKMKMDQWGILHHPDGPEFDESFLWIDTYGILHERTKRSGHLNRAIFPLREAEDVRTILDYPIPEFREEDNRGFFEDVSKIKTAGYAATVQLHSAVWEWAWNLRGMENLMMDMLADEEMAEAMLDKVTQMTMERVAICAKAKVDVLMIADDIGMQRTLLMSEELYDKWIYPRTKKIVDLARSIHPEILVLYHSCGFIEPIIPRLIDLGIDILNPVQPECMDFEEIHAKFGDRISFHGTIGTQSTMPFGTAKEIEAAVHRNLDIAGDKGGLFVAPTHLLEPDVPWESIEAYVAACRSYRKK